MAKIHHKAMQRSDLRVHQVVSAMGTGAEALHRGLHQHLAQDGWETPEEGLEHLTRSLLSVLQTQNHRMAEAVCDRQKVADYGREVRLRRDEASQEVYGLLVSLRRILHGTAGPKAIRALFGRGKTPRHPREVFALARTLCIRLEDAKTRRELCGTLGSEETLLQWLRQVEEPFRKLHFFLRQVDKTKVAERRTVRAVEKAKSEMAERQKYAVRLLEGLCGLAGMPEVARSLRPPALPPSDSANHGTTRPTCETTATGRAGSRHITQTADSVSMEADREPDDLAHSPRDAADDSWDAVDFHGSGRAHESTRDDLPGRGRSGETTSPEPVPDCEEISAVADPPMHDETESSDETDPRVWNVFQLLKTIPHRVRNARASGESVDSGERAA